MTVVVAYPQKGRGSGRFEFKLFFGKKYLVPVGHTDHDQPILKVFRPQNYLGDQPILKSHDLSQEIHSHPLGWIQT